MFVQPGKLGLTRFEPFCHTQSDDDDDDGDDEDGDDDDDFVCRLVGRKKLNFVAL